MKRDIGIDIIKFLAAFLITNSHLENVYPQSLQFLSTGGAIGDALFFFCSGFTLFLKPMGRFDSWYKKRINRIYPTVFAYAIISAFVFNISNDIKYIIIHGGGWFVSCIMIYYIIAYLIDRFMSNNLNIVFGIVTCIVVVAYIFWNKPINFSIYGHTYFKWILFFLTMLLGAIVGKRNIKIGEKKSIILLFISIVVYYTIIILSQRTYNDIQILSIIPLLGITLFTYTICNCNKANNLFNNKYINYIVMFIGGLCLEIYLIQTPLLKTNIDLVFPINYFIMFVLIILSAYLLRCFTRIFAQTFNKQDYNWKEIFKPI